MKLALCLFKYFPYGGLQIYFSRIFAECRKRGHEVHVFTREWAGDRPDSLQLHLLPARGLSNIAKDRQFVAQLSPKLLQGNFDLVVGFNKFPGLDVYVAADPCYASLREERKKNNYTSARVRHFKSYEAAVFHSELTTHILLISPGEKLKYQHSYGTPDERFTPLPAYPEGPYPLLEDPALREKSRAQLGIATNEFLILFIASSFKTKGLDRATLAFHHLPRDLRERSKLFVIGDDRVALHKIKNLVRGLSGRIKFLGAQDELQKFFLAGDLLLHPARLDNTGTVILQAIVAGLPVLATDVCGYAVHLKKSEAGMILPSPFSQPMLDHHLQQMLDGTKREHWSNNGLRYGQDPSLFGMAEQAVDTIELVALQKKR